MEWGDVKLTLCIPGDSYSHNFLRCWTATIRTLDEMGIPWLMSMGQGSNISHLRSKVAGGDPNEGEYQLPHKNADYTHQVWIDSDQVWEPDDIFRLIEHDVDIVSGCIKTADGNYALHRDHKRLDEVPSGLFEVDSCGFGFVVIKRKVFQDIAYPWFRMLPSTWGLGDDSEDVSFCRRAREAGYKIMADGDIQIGHEKPFIIGGAK